MSEGVCQLLRNRLLWFCNRNSDKRQLKSDATSRPVPPSRPRLLAAATRLSLRIAIHQRADHALIRHPALPGLALEEVEAAARQREGDFYILLARNVVVRRGQEVLDDP